MTELTTKVFAEIQANDGILFDVGSLMSCLHQISDPRQARGIGYSLVTLLVLLILAKLGGEDGMKSMSEWVKLRGQPLARLLNLSRSRMPHQTTYERVLDALDAEAVERVIGAFFAQAQAANVTIAMDGKVLRGTIPVGETQGTHLLAA